jgi:hypothetical protein
MKDVPSWWRAAALLLPVVFPGCLCDEYQCPCETRHVTCSYHGECITDGVSVYCSCDRGYHPVGLECVANDPANVCAGVTCSGNGYCRDFMGYPECECFPGFRPDPSNLLCFDESRRMPS